MRRATRLLSIVLVLTLLLPFVPEQAHAAEAKQYFADVPQTAWYAAAVNELAAQEIIGGREDGGFHPKDTITRAELLCLLLKLSQRETAVESYLLREYKDLNQNGWYAPAVTWALQEKLLGGTGAHTFSPDDPVTREQLVLILYRFHRHVMGYRFEPGEDTLFTDTAKISSWAKKAALACGQSGLVSGYEDGSFRPQYRATRAEVAQILYHYQQSYRNSPRGVSNRQLRYIMHGGGDIDGKYENSNSLNAVNECVVRGNTCIEIDLSWTADGELICAHDLPTPGMTRDEFLASTLPGDLLPMDLDMLARFLAAHPDVLIVPDIKSNNMEGLRKISEKCSNILDRFLPYVTHLSDYEEIAAMGFPNMILTTYQMSPGEKKDVNKVVRFAAEHDMTALFIPYEFSALCEQYLAAVRKENVPLLLATVNSAITMETYVQKGVDGFFTNSQTLKATRFQHWGF